jgi:peptidoglycan/xylan/chitin deacetylase (PgdA/CDA1 family)
MSTHRANNSSKESAKGCRVIVTTSWDDDDRSGLKLAEVLNSKGIPGTFYVPTGRLGEKSALAPADLRMLASAGFEVGGHTVSHAILTELGPTELTSEITRCKQKLESIMGRGVETFCYPRGRFNEEVIDVVKRAGYRGARTTEMLATAPSFPVYEMPTTVQAYPHSKANYIRNLVRLRKASSLVRSTPDLMRFESWLQLAKTTFDRVLANGGVWHLYGHPWEIEKLNLWGDLVEILNYVRDREDVVYATNVEVIQMVHGQASKSKVQSTVAS